MDIESFVIGMKFAAKSGGIDPSDATATADDILAPKTAYIADGSKVAGTIQSKSAATYYPSASDQTIASGQYLSGAQTIKAVTYDGLSAGNIKKDVVVKIGDASDDDRIVSVTGTYEGGGGGSSPWTKLAEQDFTVSTSSTTATDVGTISVPGLGDIVAAKNKIIYFSVRDKAGKRAGYCLGSDSFQIDANLLGVYYRANQSGQSVAVQSGTSMYGVFAAVMNSSSTGVVIKARYSANWSYTIDGTYHVEVYTLEWPDNVSPFA